MNDNNSTNEDLCEILYELNKHDLLLLQMIKSFMKYGEKRYYISSEITKRNRLEEERQKNEEIKEYNSKTKGIKKLDFRY